MAHIISDKEKLLAQTVTHRRLVAAHSGHMTMIAALHGAQNFRPSRFSCYIWYSACSPLGLGA